MKRRVVAFCLFAAVAAVSACAQPTPIAFEGQSKPRFLRCTLRADRQNMYSTNYLSMPAVAGVGRPAEVKMYSTNRVDLDLNKIMYQMYPVSQPFDTNAQNFVEKFFVDDVRSLGLEKLEAVRKTNIQNGHAEIGMTKEQVYMTLGPPAYVDFDYDASNLTYSAIMEKNRWVYNDSSIMGLWSVQKAFIFDNQKLVQTVP